MGKTTTERAVFTLTLGDRIRKARVAAGLERQELAAKIGVSRSTVSSWERDESEPRVSDAIRIALACGVDFNELCAPWELNPQPAEERATGLAA